MSDQEAVSAAFAELEAKRARMFLVGDITENLPRLRSGGVEPNATAIELAGIVLHEARIHAVSVDHASAAPDGGIVIHMQDRECLGRTAQVITTNDGRITITWFNDSKGFWWKEQNVPRQIERAKIAGEMQRLRQEFFSYIIRQVST